MKRTLGLVMAACLLLSGCAASQTPAVPLENSLPVTAELPSKYSAGGSAVVSSLPPVPVAADAVEAFSVQASQAEEAPSKALPAEDASNEPRDEATGSLAEEPSQPAADAPKPVDSPTASPAPSPKPSSASKPKDTTPPQKPAEPAQKPAEATTEPEQPAQEPIENAATEPEQPMQEPAAEQVPESKPSTPTAADAAAFIGRSASSLIAAIGRPISSSYAPSCLREEGEDGELVYNGFTVYTYRLGDVEIVQDVL